MTAALSRRLAALEQRRPAAAAVITQTEEDLLERSMCILLAHNSVSEVESFADRLADGSETTADREVLQQLVHAGQPDPAGFVCFVARVSRSF